MFLAQARLISRDSAPSRDEHGSRKPPPAIDPSGTQQQQPNRRNGDGFVKDCFQLQQQQPQHHHQPLPTTHAQTPVRAQSPARGDTSSRREHSKDDNDPSSFNDRPPCINDPAPTARSAKLAQLLCFGSTDWPDDSNLERAIAESRAAHEAHERRREAQDVHFRRETERASTESVAATPARGRGGRPGAECPGRRDPIKGTREDNDKLVHRESRRSLLDGGGVEYLGRRGPGEGKTREDDDDDLAIRQESHRSFLEEQTRRRHDAEERHARKFELALRWSELHANEAVERHFVYDLERALEQSALLARQRTEEQLKLIQSEEEMVRRVLARSRTAEEAACSGEEEVMKLALKMSLAEQQGGEDTGEAKKWLQKMMRDSVVWNMGCHGVGKREEGTRKSKEGGADRAEDATEKMLKLSPQKEECVPSKPEEE